MKKTVYLAIVLAAISAVSCQKEKELHPVGGRINFTAATEYRNGTETRTIYSGVYTQTSTDYERIDWENDDQITILYHHEANGAGSNESVPYDIVDNTQSTASEVIGQTTYPNRKGRADIAVAQGSNALEWADAETHKFFGLYPSVGSGRTLTTATVNGNLVGRVTGLSIPSRQYVKYNASQGKYLPEDMDYAYMVAYKDMSNNAEQSVDLPFSPVVTAVEFRLHLPDTKPSFSVSKVELKSSSTALAGSYSVDITGYDSTSGCVTWTAGNFPQASSSSNVIVEFHNASGSAVNPSLPNQATSPDPQTYLNFTLFVLPQQINNPELLIKYTDSNNAQEQTIKKITLTNLQLDPGKKYLVYNTQAGYDKFEYVLSKPDDQDWEGHVAHTFANIPVTTSIKRSKANNSHTENVTWKVQCKSPIHDAWFNGLPPDQIYNNFTLTEDHTNNTFSVGFPAAGTFTDNTITAFDAATEILQKREPLSSARDLSMYDVAGNSLGSRTTANCYVVSRPGTYRIPFYYGNAVVGGQTNLSAYYPDSVSAISGAWGSGNTVETQNYYLPRFYNAAGVYITNPNIITDITNSSYGGVGTLTAGVTWFDSFTVTPTVSGNGANDYIQFTITPENIKPGNILIQLASSTVGGNWPVIWSWHIWVTDRDLTPQNGVMPVNLGWVDADVVVPGAVTRYQDQTLTLRLVQVENGVEVNWGTEFTLSTKGGEVVSVENNSQGKNPHFQWGRKDPFNEDASTILLMKHADNGTSGVHYWRGIRTNNVMLEGEKSLTWMDGPAVPLYQAATTSSYYIWNIVPNHEKYGPFTTAQKNALTGSSFNPSGTTWTGTTTTSYTTKNNSVNLTWFWNDDLCLLGNCSHSGHSGIPLIPIGDWNIGTNYGNDWTIKEGVTISSSVYNEIQSRVDAGQITAAVWNNFKQNCLTTNTTTTEPYTLTLNGNPYPYGPHSQAVADVLILQSGVFAFYAVGNAYNDIDATLVTETSQPYTTDAARSAGSILYNLWSAALYNENASVTKYKTVYDPCPVGFTVPTIDTYLGSSWASQVGNNKEATGLAAMSDYPQSSARINDLSVAVSGTADSPLYTGSPAKGFYWTDRPCNMEVVNAANKHTIDGYQYHTDSYILMTETSTSTVAHYNRRAAASIRPMQDPGSNIYPAATASPGNASGGLEGVSTGTDLY